jgi:hypothetical protein
MLKSMKILSKISSSKYAQDMLDNDYLFFQSLSSFRTSAYDTTGRLDPRELNLKNEQLIWLSITVDSKTIKFDRSTGLRGQFNEYLSEPTINCCSLHMI